VDGRAYVYVTDRALTGGPARITCFEIATDGPNPPFTAISTSEGVSHPFVFGHAGEAYMLVQTGDDAIALYRATRFPDQWSFEGTVLDGRPGRSPVLCFHDGRLWLFVNEAVRGGRYDDELHLYHADSLAGPWHPHPRNPIVSDVRHARPGGRPFARGDALARPARDASQPGRGTLTLQRVDRMTLDDYREQKVAELDPAWTKRNRVARAYDLSARFEVLDGAWLVPAARARA
jgi:hypothetical protein